MSDNPGRQDLDLLMTFAHRLADAAASQTLKHFRTGHAVDNKPGHWSFDPVTIADRDAEKVMRDLIADSFPEHGILGEEHGQTASASGLTWVLDPIDGTRSFIMGMPIWGTLIGLTDKSTPILGMMDQPYTGERYAGFGDRAERRDRNGTARLATRPCRELGEAILCATDPAMFKHQAERSAFDRVAERVKLRRFNGDCYNYCLLAAGSVDLVIESSLQIYDIAPLIPIIEAAGGIVTDWAGGSAAKGGQVLAAATRDLHQQALELVRSAALAD